MLFTTEFPSYYSLVFRLTYYKDYYHLEIDHYFSHLHHWGPLIIGDVLFSVEHRKEPQFNLGQVFYSHFVQ